MVKTLNPDEKGKQESATRKRDRVPSESAPADTLGLMSPQDVQAARKRFVAWIRWYMDWHQADVPNESALARKLGVTPAAVHYLLAKDSVRLPSFETLLAARAIIGMSIDALLFTDPPSARPPRP
jgi:transcriptional regulator with XRE-family HTH domain